MHKQSNSTSCGIAAALQVAAKHSAAVAKYEHMSERQVAREQDRVHRIASRTGMPWPKSLGTSVWAMTKLLSLATGLKYRRYAWLNGIEEVALGALKQGHDVAFFTGGGTLKLRGKWCTADVIPRHVITASMDGDELTIFEPAEGKYWKMAWSDFVTRSRSCERERAFGYWPRVIVAVIPN